MPSSPETDFSILERWRKGEDAAVLGPLVERHQQKIFALSLYLANGDRDQAQKIAVSSFAAAVPSAFMIKKKDGFLAVVARKVVEQSRGVKGSDSSVEIDFASLPPERKKLLQMTRKALFELPFDAKAFMLLRDQIGFSFQAISYILGVNEERARLETIQARAKLRDKLQEMLGRDRKS